MDTSQITRIYEYLKILNNEIENINKDLLDFCIAEVGDRVSLYLNSDIVPTKVERILARIINTGFKKTLDEQKSDNGVITSLSDNGQSISFSNEVKRYFTTASDEELFTGFTSLLSRYRRVKVVYPKQNENANC